MPCSDSTAERGRAYVDKELWGLLTQPQKDKLKVLKAQINRCSSSILLAYIGKQYLEEVVRLAAADDCQNPGQALAHCKS